METRPLGDTGHESSVLTLGCFALQELEQGAANRAVELALERGVNHVDVAPTYGDAEAKLAPKLGEHREDLFVGCKTQERSYAGAREALEESLDRLGTDHLDLYQFHAVTTAAEIDRITAEDGALEAFREAKREGIVNHVGLTSHGPPDVILSAIDRIPELETVMFPMNFVLAGKGGEYDYAPVLERAEAESLGTIGIKAFAKGPWPDDLTGDRRPYRTWYEPHDDPDRIADCVDFALSQGLTTIASAGDPKLLPMMLQAGARFEPLSEAEQARLREDGSEMDSPVPTT